MIKFTHMAPEELVVTTSAIEPYGGDEITISRSVTTGSTAFLSIYEHALSEYSPSRVASSFLTLDDAIAVRDQLSSIIDDAIATSNLAHRLDPRLGARVNRIQGVAR